MWTVLRRDYACPKIMLDHADHSATVAEVEHRIKRCILHEQVR